MFHQEFAPGWAQSCKRTAAACFVLALFSAPGCSKDDVKKMAATVQQKSASIAESTKNLASQAVEKAGTVVEETLPENGQVTLQVSPPLEISSANIAVISIGDGRKNVVQIANYDLTAAPKDYPSILIQGATTAGDPASLAGETVACELYVRESPTSPIAMTAAGQPAQITFASFDPVKKTVSAKIAEVALIGSDNKPVPLSGGSILAVLSNGGS